MEMERRGGVVWAQRRKKHVGRFKKPAEARQQWPTKAKISYQKATHKVMFLGAAENNRIRKPSTAELEDCCDVCLWERKGTKKTRAGGWPLKARCPGKQKIGTVAESCGAGGALELLLPNRKAHEWPTKGTRTRGSQAPSCAMWPGKGMLPLRVAQETKLVPTLPSCSFHLAIGPWTGALQISRKGMLQGMLLAPCCFLCLNRRVATKCMKVGYLAKQC